MKNNIHVLVVDDSAVVRQGFKNLLKGQSDISVSVTGNPLLAIESISRKRPNVIVLDLEMTPMSGLEFLKKLMASDPIPVIICSMYCGPGSEAAIQALEYGALELMTKPKVGVGSFLSESSERLIACIRSAAHANVKKNIYPADQEMEKNLFSQKQIPQKSFFKNGKPGSLICIGASTGGPQALERILRDLPENSPPILIVQHMPEMVIPSFAQRLNSQSKVTVKVAENGEILKSGVAYISPGNFHMTLQRESRDVFIHLNQEAAVFWQRPSVDVLFKSVAATIGKKAIGVLLTGMGRDGAAGLLAMKNTGSKTLVQNEKTCVVFGMPREAIEIGAAGMVLSLQNMAHEILLAADLTE